MHENCASDKNVERAVHDILYLLYLGQRIPFYLENMHKSHNELNIGVCLEENVNKQIIDVHKRPGTSAKMTN